MAFENCPVCGKLFEKHSFYEVCSDCFLKNQNDFSKVRDYLYANPNKNILEIANATGVSINKIRAFIRQGKIGSSI